MISTKLFNKLSRDINTSSCGTLFGNAQVAILAAPSIIVEIIVKDASVKSGIPMDWNYAGGRAIVWTKKKENIKECRRHLMMNIPTTDLTLADL